MKNSRFLKTLLLLILISGCSNPIEESKEIFQKSKTPKLDEGIDFFSETVTYVYYANPDNYWYPDYFTANEIIADEWREGLIGLNNLSNMINQLPDYNYNFNHAKEKLKTQIKNSKQNINEKRQALNRARMYGISKQDLFALSMLSSEEDRAKESEKVKQFPKDVSSAFFNAVEEIYDTYEVTAFKMAELENKAIKATQPNDEELREIHNSFKNFIKSKINESFVAEDTIARNEMTKEFFALYEDQFSIIDFQKEEEIIIKSDNKKFENCYINTLEQNENGRTVNRLKFNVDDEYNVIGIYGYYPEYEVDLNSWEGEINGKYTNGTIKGKYVYQSEGSKITEPFTIKIINDLVSYEIMDNKILIDGMERESNSEMKIFTRIDCD
jgi:predicted  nucleic acid-binding Zn-ribbon protein